MYNKNRFSILKPTDFEIRSIFHGRFMLLVFKIVVSTRLTVLIDGVSIHLEVLIK